MTRHPRFVWILTIALGLALACGPVSTGLSPSPTGGASKKTPVSESSVTEESGKQDLPLTPDPLNVQVSLDTANAQTGVYPAELYVQTANGTAYTLLLPEILVSEDVDGILAPAYGTPVTITPVIGIDGLPFSQGFLAAVQLAPHGLFMTQSATLMLTIPGEFPAAELVAFAWDGSGDNFHLFPAKFISGGGQTIVLMDILHIGADGVGVVQATSQEIADQHAHVPEGQAAQDEDLLVPLPPLSGDEDLLVPIMEGILRNQHETEITSAIDRVFEIEGNCNYVDVVAQQFITWYTRVLGASAEYRFQEEIARDTTVLQNSLVKCMTDVCSLCMGKPPGDKQHTDAFLIHAFYAERIAGIAGNSNDALRWRDLANACAINSGRRLPYPIVAYCGPPGTPGCGATSAPPPACPVP
jgi:hypothetical protein